MTHQANSHRTNAYRERSRHSLEYSLFLLKIEMEVIALYLIITIFLSWFLNFILFSITCMVVCVCVTIALVLPEIMLHRMTFVYRRLRS